MSGWWINYQLLEFIGCLSVVVASSTVEPRVTCLHEKFPKKNERFQTPHQHSPHSPHSRVSALNSVDGKFMWLLYSRERAIRSSSADGIENDIEKYLNNLNDQAFLADCLLSFGFFFDYWGLMMMVRWQINKQRQFVNNGWSFSSTRRA